MTLDEAIKLAEEVAKENENTAQIWHEKTKNRLVDFCDKALQAENNCIKCAKEYRQLVEWLKELKQLRERTRWISTSERLPNQDEYIRNNGLFNVTDGNRIYSEWYDIYGKQGFGEPTIGGFRVDNAVTHWMPLPELYNVENGVVL